MKTLGGMQRDGRSVQDVGFSIFNQMFAKFSADGRTGETTFAEYCQRPTNAEEAKQVQITLSNKAGTMLDNQVKDAIEKAVHDLIVEGIKDGYWSTKSGQEVDDKIVAQYNEELTEANLTQLHNRFTFKRRTDNAVGLSIGTTSINGDYVNSEYKLNTGLSYKRYINKHFNLNLGLNRFTLANTNLFKKDFMSIDVNLEYNIIPFDKLSPFIYIGGGSNISDDFNNLNSKVQIGGGIEYLVNDSIGISLFAENNIVFSDLVDGLIEGERDDMYFKIGFGLNFYLGKYNTSKDSQRIEERKRKKELKRIKKENIEKELNKKASTIDESKNEGDEN